jgi:hypothetical protein
MLERNASTSKKKRIAIGEEICYVYWLKNRWPIEWVNTDTEKSESIDINLLYI